MSSNAERSTRLAAPNAPVRARTAPPMTTTARSSDGVPTLGQFARLERFNLAQGFAELVEELTDRIAPIMRRQSGMRSFTLFSDETSGEYISLTYWDTLDHLQAYERSADEWRVRDIMAEHLTAVPQIEVYQTHNVAPAGAEETAVVVADATPAAIATETPVDIAPAAALPQSMVRAQEAGVTVVEPIEGACPISHPIKGNHSSSGDFIYHLPGGQAYDRTRPEVCFATEDEARTAGFRAPRG